MAGNLTSSNLTRVPNIIPPGPNVPVLLNYGPPAPNPAAVPLNITPPVAVEPAVLADANAPVAYSANVSDSEAVIVSQGSMKISGYVNMDNLTGVSKLGINDGGTLTLNGALGSAEAPIEQVTILGELILADNVQNYINSVKLGPNVDFVPKGCNESLTIGTYEGPSSNIPSAANAGSVAAVQAANACYPNITMSGGELVIATDSTLGSVQGAGKITVNEGASLTLTGAVGTPDAAPELFVFGRITLAEGVRSYLSAVHIGPEGEISNPSGMPPLIHGCVYSRADATEFLLDHNRSLPQEAEKQELSLAGEAGAAESVSEA